MEPSQYVYDSITSGALRMARRHWYLVAAAAVIGLVGGLALMGSGSTWTSEADVRILFESVSPGPVENPEHAVVDPSAVALRVEASTDDIELPDDSAVAVQGDSAAGSLSVTATAPTENAAMSALESATAYTEALIVRELGAETETRVAALESLSDADTARLAAADERLATLQSTGQTPGPSDPAVLERTAASDALAATNSELELARSRLESLPETSVSASSAVTEESGSSPLIPVALAVLAAGAAFMALLVVQAFDGRIRRRMHIERSAPRCSVVGVLPRNPSDGELSVLARSVARFVTDHDVQKLSVVSLAGSIDDRVVTLLEDATGRPVQTQDLNQAQTEIGSDGLGVLFNVSFGSVSEDSLQSAVAAATTAGTDAVAVTLTEVPTRDYSWAAASVQ